MCKKIKIYRKNKYEFFKLLFISERYFIDISMKIIIALSTCKRNERNDIHIVIVMNRFNKKNYYFKFFKDENCNTSFS